MPQSYFIWNGADCRSKGIILRGPVPIVRPEERVKHVEIPGRDGDVTETEGENIFNSYIQTAEISVRGGFRVREIFKWLRGSGYVTFSGEPDRKQAARIIGAITLNKVSRNMDHWAGEVQFYCQPLKEKLNDNTVTITSSGSTVRNNGDVACKPIITATASGTTMIINIKGRSLTLTGATSGHVYKIDTDMMEISDMTPFPAVVVTKNSSGKFPVLQPGSNAVAGSGWSQLVFDRRERFL